MLKMKSLIALGILPAALAAASPAEAQTIDGPKVEWNHSVWGKQRAFTAGVEAVGEYVKSKTGGKFTIKVHYGEALSKDKENLDGIKIGAFESADFCNFYHPGKNPAWMVFSLPFLRLDDWDVSKEVRNNMLKHPTLVADMDRWNARIYTSGLLPQYEFMGKGKPPKNLEDWKGLRVRAGGGIGDAMKILGATLSTVPATEVYTAVERGTLDAASLPFTYSHASYQLETITNWYTANLSPGTAECATVFNKDAYKKLPDSYKKLLDEAQPMAHNALVKAYQDIDKVNLPKFKAKLTQIVYTPEQLKKFEETAGKPVWEKWVADNQSKFNARGLLNDLLAEIDKAEKKFGKKK